MPAIEEDLGYGLPPGPVLHLIATLRVTLQVNLNVRDLEIRQQLLRTPTERTAGDCEKKNASQKHHPGPGSWQYLEMSLQY